MPRVSICDKLEAAGIDLLKAAGIEVDNRPGLKGAELAAALHAADGMIVRSGDQGHGDLLDNPGKLRASCGPASASTTSTCRAATRKGIIVMNTPGGNTTQHRRADDHAPDARSAGTSPPPTPR